MNKTDRDSGKINSSHFQDFKPQKMIDWYSPSQLATTGIRAVISGVFGNYADKREIQAALTKHQEDFKPYEFSNKEELWIDYVSDLGSGFNSTYSIAYLLGRKELTVSDQTQKQRRLKRGDILVMGGDEVYPTATAKEYKNRIIGPYTSSLSYVEENAPTLFAIPGNHDWYDGLSSFIKLFCQQRWIGGWQTKQTRSYFAAKLPNNWWLWGIDIQLNADIDKPQIDYFDHMFFNETLDGDRIILCTAEPVWVYQEYQPDDKPYKNLQFFTDRYSKKQNKQNKKLSFPLILTGDMHHYTGFKNIERETWKITAGGGGAFTHPTHQVPDVLNLDDGKYEKKKTYPTAKESRRMAWKNLLFPFINLRFGVLFGFLYMLFGWFCGTSDVDMLPGSRSFLEVLAFAGLSDLGSTVHSLWFFLSYTPGLILFLTFLFVGILVFTDRDRKKPLPAWIVGILHASIQVILLLLAVWLTSYIVLGIWGFSVNSLSGILLSALLLALCGWLFSGFTMSIYLMCAILLLKIHETEAFSSFRDEDHKNFIRMHIDENQLTIYPIKIPKVYKKWEKAEKIKKGEDPWFVLRTGENIEYKFIQEPITIPTK